jgi:hypothetical protein
MAAVAHASAAVYFAPPRGRACFVPEPYFDAVACGAGCPPEVWAAA